MKRYKCFRVKIGNKYAVYPSLQQVYQLSDCFGFVPDQVVGRKDVMRGDILQFMKSKNKRGWILK